MITKAKMIAEFLHCGQSYGDSDYIDHLEQVYNILREFNVSDEDVLVAAWLHDILEDTAATYKLIEEYFGKSVANIVFNVTNEIGTNRQERNKKTYAKMKDDYQAICLKLADRIANTRKSKERKGSKFQKMYSREYPLFRDSLYADDQDHNMKAIWEELDRLYS